MNVILESKLINVQNTKQPLSDRKQIEMPKKGINSVASSNCKLSSLSPKKTVEGFIGGLFCTMIWGYAVRNLK